MNYDFNAVIKEHLIKAIDAYHRIIDDACCADEIAKASAYCFECKCALNAILKTEEEARDAAIQQEKQEAEVMDSDCFVRIDGMIYFKDESGYLHTDGLLRELSFSDEPEAICSMLNED